jgi:D-alanyl-D-alanine carboxypeptidase
MLRNPITTAVLVAAGLLFSPGSTRAATLQQVLDEARAASGAPGASAAIMNGGNLTFAGSSGIADLATGRPVTEDTLYSLASVTKTFTSTMVLRLYEQGRLGLDDVIEPYVPPYIPSTNQVTIRDLLGMTSGYHDVEGDPIIVHWLADPNHVWTRSQILTRVQPVTFTPGTQYQYSNTNYVILGGIIDSVSNLGVGGEFQQFIVQPVGLDDDAFFDRVPSAAPRIRTDTTSRAANWWTRSRAPKCSACLRQSGERCGRTEASQQRLPV